MHGTNNAKTCTVARAQLQGRKQHGKRGTHQSSHPALRRTGRRTADALTVLASLTHTAQHASGQPLQPVGCLLPKAGRTCLPGRTEPAHPTDLKGSASPVNGGMGGNTASRTRNFFLLLPSLPPPHRTLLRSKAGPHALRSRPNNADRVTSRAPASTSARAWPLRELLGTWVWPPRCGIRRPRTRVPAGWPPG